MYSSAHVVYVYRVFRKHPTSWLSNHEIYESIRQDKGLALPPHQAKVSERTVRHHTKLLLGRRLIEVREVYPGYRYRLQTGAAKAVVRRMEEAADALGLELSNAAARNFDALAVLRSGAATSSGAAKTKS